MALKKKNMMKRKHTFVHRNIQYEKEKKIKSKKKKTKWNGSENHFVHFNKK